ncbi:cytochrome P450 [Bisporella sp. PMI_857]|nr:cytochrome P450 [Bisporella sp. PMI_857]
MFPATEVATSAICGVLLHLGYFIHGEHHMQSPTIFRMVLLAPVAVFIVHLKLSKFDLGSAAIASAWDVTACSGSLLASMVIYRSFFHRTRNFPGPKLAGVSKLYHMFNVAPKSDQFRWLELMHQRYGDFVRTGPNEISIFTPEAVTIVYGPKSRCIRSDFYDMTKPLTSVVACRSLSDHSVQRKYWDMGFSSKALKDYEKRVYGYARTLAQDLEMNVNKPIAINSPIEHFVFDVMGNVIFGQDWNLIKTKKGKYHDIIANHTQAIGTLGPLTPVPWMFRILFSIHALLDGWRTFRAWAIDECNTMVESKSDQFCVFSELVSQIRSGKGNPDQTYMWLLGNFITAMGGASTPVYSSIIFLVYYVARDPRILAQLQAELATVDDISNYDILQSLQYLNALIYETLRLHPAVPTGGLRDTPPEGITIAGQYIPGNTTVAIPQYSLHRLESCFEKPNEFIPERWTTKPHLIKDIRAWIPFNAGIHTCVGKYLGLMELRYFTAVVFSKYDIAFAPGEDNHDVQGKMTDTFTVEPGQLKVVLTERSII